MIPFKKFPPEVRNMIYPHNNALAVLHSDNMMPDLLIALAADKDLFAEALRLYKKINARVTGQNWEEFKKMRMKQLLTYEHLKVICDKDWIDFRAQKIILHNNFESITYVVGYECAKKSRNPVNFTWNDVGFLVSGSRTGVNKITFKIPLGFVPIIKEIKERTVGNVKPSLEGEWYDKKHTGYQVLVWEKEDGKSFRTNRNGGLD